jgi:CheY-like chemotaxis protein
MAFARDLLSKRVAVGYGEEHLKLLVPRLAEHRAQLAVVLERGTECFLGLIGLEEVAARQSAGNRILADLISPVLPLVFSENETAENIARLLIEHDVSEAVVESVNNRFLGVVTSESVFAWLWQQHPAPTLPRRPEGNGLVPFSPNRAPSPRGSVILVVEDHTPSRTALRAYLTRLSYQVVEASTVAEALQRADDHRVDLVISDIGLPDQSGYELMSALREKHGLVGIAMSALGSREDVTRSKAAGFILHLTKPLAGPGLDNVLSAYFAMKHSAPPFA